MNGAFHPCFTKMLFCLFLGAASKAMKSAQRGTVLDSNLESIYYEIVALGKPLDSSVNCE